MIKDKILNAYTSQLFRRYDDEGYLYYYSAEDFDGLKKESFDFFSPQQNRLKGYFYSYENPTEGRIIIFDHGLGAGHRAYMKEIELLCRHGFIVYSYDHTGCRESEGESTNGLLQSLADLDSCIAAIRAESKYKNCDISVVGHSWGGFSCANICAYHKDISHIVVISGFVSAENAISQLLSGPLMFFRTPLYELEKQANPKYFSANAATALKETDAKILLVYSADDPLVKKKNHFDALKKALKDRDNVKFLLVDGKGHNPNYTHTAVCALKECEDELRKRFKENKLSTPQQREDFKNSFDWDKITQQDESVWKEIFEVLDA
ncbi:MAG: alpha/beta hydrolase [Clostridia bacterium]|nr:alpha/beta hydrolase [Clostridia bacterium]